MSSFLLHSRDADGDEVLRLATPSISSAATLAQVKASRSTAPPKGHIDWAEYENAHKDGHDAVDWAQVAIGLAKQPTTTGR